MPTGPGTRKRDSEEAERLGIRHIAGPNVERRTHEGWRLGVQNAKADVPVAIFVDNVVSYHAVIAGLALDAGVAHSNSQSCREAVVYLHKAVRGEGFISFAFERVPEEQFLRYMRLGATAKFLAIPECAGVARSLG